MLNQLNKKIEQEYQLVCRSYDQGDRAMNDDGFCHVKNRPCMRDDCIPGEHCVMYPKEDKPTDDYSQAKRRIEELERQVRGYQQECREVEQELGKALGYPWYKDDQKNFPGTTEADGVCVGEHTPGTIAAEASTKLVELKHECREIELHRAWVKIACETLGITAISAANLRDYVQGLEQKETSLREVVSALQKDNQVLHGENLVWRTQLEDARTKLASLKDGDND